MKRMKEIEIVGKKFPLNFSTVAAKAVDEKFGGIENMEEILSDGTVANIMGKLVWLLYLLIEQGVAYQKIIEGEEIQAYSIEELEILVGIGDIKQIQKVLIETIGVGMETEVEVETEGKNEETTQAS